MPSINESAALLQASNSFATQKVNYVFPFRPKSGVVPGFKISHFGYRLHVKDLPRKPE